MQKRAKILVTNDDSIHAPGIRHLCQALAPIADLWIAAPAYEKSGVGLSVSLHSPLTLEPEHWEEQNEVWKINNGTPADCVRMGLRFVMKEKPDLVISGINRGSNAGRTLLYSGTVGAVIEASLQGIPGIAFSCANYENPNYAITHEPIRAIVAHMLKEPLPLGSFLNVNFPENETPKGCKLSRQGKSYHRENFTQHVHPSKGHHYYWTGYRYEELPEEEESEIALLNEGFITCTPIQVQHLTDLDVFAKRKESFDSHFSTPTYSETY